LNRRVLVDGDREGGKGTGHATSNVDVSPSSTAVVDVPRRREMGEMGRIVVMCRTARL
jgi:hypothetical protein